jgi:hypothetical protein
MLLSRVLALMVCVAAIVGLKTIRSEPQPFGFLVDVATAPDQCGDSYNAVLTVHGNHRDN